MPLLLLRQVLMLEACLRFALEASALCLHGGGAGDRDVLDRKPRIGVHGPVHLLLELLRLCFWRNTS